MTGIGHETDFTIADFVADVRAPTPTAAAEIVSESQQAHLRLLAHEGERLEAAMMRRLDRQAQILDGLGLRLGRPSDRLSKESNKLSRLQHSLQYGVQTRLVDAEHRLAQRAPQLQSLWARQMQGHEQGLVRLSQALKLLDPQQVLARGFAWLEDGQARPLTSVGQVQAGQELVAHLSDGHVRAQVNSVQAN